MGDSELYSVESIFQEGMDLLESDHCEEALHAFEFVVQQQPYNADALFHQGVTLTNLRRLEEAIIVFKRALNLAPTEVLFHTHCGYALMLSGRQDDALEHFDYALDLQPDNLQVLTYKACTLAEKRNLAAARTLLESTLEQYPDNPDVMFNYGAVLANMGEDERALEQLARVLRKNPNHRMAIRQKAHIHLRNRRLEEAISCFRESVALSPGDQQLWQELLDALVEKTNWRAIIACSTEALEAVGENAQLYLYRGRAYLERRQIDRAIADLKRARELAERSVEPHYLLAQAYAMAGRTRHALQSINRAIQLKPDDSRVMLLKAYLHHKQGEFETEANYLALLRETNPTEFDYVRLTASNLIARGKVDQACTTVEDYLRQRADHVPALLLCADLSEKAGRTERVRECFTKVHSALRPGDYAFRAYAAFLLREQDSEAAAELLTKGCALYPDDPGLHSGLATALQATSRHEQCVTVLREFLANHSVTPELHWLLGRSYFALGQHEDAVAQFQQARNLETQCNGNSAPSFRWLLAEAFALYRLERTGEAIKLLETHIAQFTKYEREYAEALGELYEAAGHLAKAQAIYSQALQLDPDAAMLHFRMARATIADGKRSVAIRHLRTALALDSALRTTVIQDPVFQRHRLYLAASRVVGFGFVFLPLRYLAAHMFGCVINSVTGFLRRK